MMRHMLTIPLDTQPEQERGFTLIELMVSMVIALVLLAGLYGNFIMQSRVQNAQAEVVEAAEDLRIAAQIMQSELRMARDICWDTANTRLIYRPLSSANALVGACSSVAAGNGAFDLRSAGGTHPTPYVCWQQPGSGTCEELVRNLDANGFVVSPTSNADMGVMRSIRLISTYKDHTRTDRNWEVRFDVWPRNH